MDKTYKVMVAFALELTQEVLEASSIDLDELNAERAELGAQPLEVGQTYFDTAVISGVPHEYAVEDTDALV